MEPSKAILRLGNSRISRSHRCLNSNLNIPVRNPTDSGTRDILPILLLPIPTLFHLRILLFHLDPKMDLLPMEMGLGRMGMGLQTKILEIPR